MLSAKTIINENVHGLLAFKPQVCECGSHDFIFDEKRYETICSHCGLVLDEPRINLAEDVAVYTMSNEDNPSRVGAPLTSSITIEVYLLKLDGQKYKVVKRKKLHGKE